MRNPKGNIAFTLVVATILYLPQTGCYVGWQQLLSQLVTSSLSLKLIIIAKSCCVYGFGTALLQSIVQCNLTSDFGAAFTLKHCAMYFFKTNVEVYLIIMCAAENLVYYGLELTWR